MVLKRVTYSLIYMLRDKLDDLVISEGVDKKADASAFGSAFAKFKSMDDCGVKDSKLSKPKSGHRNTIR